MSKTYRRAAKKGETHRPIIIFQGAAYETTASPSFIYVGQGVRVQVLPPRSGTRRILVAPLNKEGWETFEEV